MFRIKYFFTFTFALAIIISATANEKNKKKDTGYIFKDVLILPATSVKDQHRSGTCWAFAGLSLFESEMLRLQKPVVDLSEMFIVWNTYFEKAVKFVRTHGNLNFSAGGAFHDVTNMVSRYGIVPESVYDGLKYGEDKHVHGEMDRVLREFVDAVVENKNNKLSTAWREAFSSTLDSYLGVIPNRFTYEGVQYTPHSFAENFVGLNMADYVEITSFTHHPYYSEFILEIPDNWSWDKAYNIPVNELEETIDYALNNGYTVAWAADVSEKGFASSNKGIAVIPAAPLKDMSNAELLKWESLPDRERENELYKLEQTVPELEIDQEMRQEAFDNFQTTDDHGMHIIGYAKDQFGNIFYKAKNSWGDYNLYNGYLYVSKPYIRYKTMTIMLHKEGIPKHIREKLEL